MINHHTTFRSNLLWHPQKHLDLPILPRIHRSASWWIPPICLWPSSELDMVCRLRQVHTWPGLVSATEKHSALEPDKNTKFIQTNEIRRLSYIVHTTKNGEKFCTQQVLKPAKKNTAISALTNAVDVVVIPNQPRTPPADTVVVTGTV